MGGKSKSPNYEQAAIAQGEANREVVRDQTFANRPTQMTPWGSTSWTPQRTTDPSTGEATTAWTQVESLTPELQDIFNKQVNMQGARTDIAGLLTGRMQNEFGNPMDWRGLSPMGQVPVSQFTMPEGDVGDPYQTRQAAEDAVYGKAQSRLQPQFDSKRQALEVQMRNQGLRPGDAAWASRMEGLGRQENDAYAQAQYDAVTGGRAESGQMFGQMMDRNQNNYSQALGANRANFSQAMQGSQYANAIRQQQLTEQMQQRGFSLNEINALLSGQQVQNPQMPNFTAASAAQPAPIYQGAVDQGNANQMGLDSLMGGVGQLGSLAMGFM